MLLVVFSVVMALALARGRRPDCRCFGQLRPSPIGWASLVRNAMLLAAAVVVVAQASGDTSRGAATGVDGTSVLWVVGTALAGLVVIGMLVGGNVIVRLLRQRGRLLLRLEHLERLFGVDPNLPELPVGSPAPEFSLPGLSGSRTSLADLLARRHPVLLLFVDAGCGACDELIFETARWGSGPVETLTVARIVGGGRDAAAEKAASWGSSGDLLIQDHFEVGELYGISQVPSAIALDVDGRVASPVAVGSDAVRSLAGGLTGEQVNTSAGGDLAVPSRRS